MCFEKVSEEEFSKLLEILRQRLPESCITYNQILNYPADPDQFCVYTYSYQTTSITNENESTWILVTVKRDDWGKVVTISGPRSGELPVLVKFALEETNFVNWSDPFLFLSQTPAMSDFIINLHINKYFNIIKIEPSNLFCMKPEDALKLEISSSLPGNYKVRNLDQIGVDFLTKIWKYTTTGTADYMKRSISKYISSGIYDSTNNNVVCAAFMPNFGMVCTLQTHPDHRRKGYATQVVKHIYKQAATRGLYPCLDTQIVDKVATAFHSSIPGNNIVCKLDYICHKIF